MGYPTFQASGQTIAKTFGSGDFGSGSITPYCIYSGAVVSGSIGATAVCEPNVDPTLLPLLGTTELSRRRAKGTCSGLYFSASGTQSGGQRWYPAGFAIPSYGYTAGNASCSGNAILTYPFPSEEGGYVDDMRVALGAAGVSGLWIHLGIYDNVDPTFNDLWPGTLLSEGSGLGIQTTIINYNPAITLDANKLYWFALRFPTSISGWPGAVHFKGAYTYHMTLFGCDSLFKDAAIDGGHVYGIRMPWSGTPLPPTFPTSSGIPIYYSGYQPFIAAHFAS